jgi:hypothetical protein
LFHDCIFQVSDQDLDPKSGIFRSGSSTTNEPGKSRKASYLLVENFSKIGKDLRLPWMHHPGNGRNVFFFPEDV